MSEARPHCPHVRDYALMLGEPDDGSDEKSEDTPGLASAALDAELEHPLLHCPVRGPLNVAALAKDGLTVTEEARRIDFINFLLDRKYPKANIAVETVVLSGLGESGRNRLRADVIVYDAPVRSLAPATQAERLGHAVLVAEIKRDAAKRVSGVTCQLEPAMRLLPGMNVLGAYWDDVNRLLFTKVLAQGQQEQVVLEIREDALANLPPFGIVYKSKPITVDALTPPENMVATLLTIANVMRSHGVNDEHVRYKETVKLLLARYCDERQATDSQDRRLKLQVLRGTDPDFLNRVSEMYVEASRRYSNAQTLWSPDSGSELAERTLREIVKSIQGINFSSASSETMQQVFMSFVPAVFKKSLDQYFTPATLIETMVAMTEIGPNDKVADPAMGTADFLTAAMSYRTARGDADVNLRVFGMDSDAKAFDLAIINMILNHDGQNNLECGDSIAQPNLWKNEMSVALCNPPFGARSLETRPEVLAEYDLGHLWERQPNGSWVKTAQLHPAQQLGIMFIERCWKLLGEGGRLAIILPEGYLSTPAYGYVRQWILNNFQVLSLVELPRRIFMKSDADLRSNILVAKKLLPKRLGAAQEDNYPIHAELVRNVGYKLGKGFQPILTREQLTGLEIRDKQNRPVLHTDFSRVLTSFIRSQRPQKQGGWRPARYGDVARHPLLDMKPRRLMPKAIENLRRIRSGKSERLKDIADVLDKTIDVVRWRGAAENYRLVEGQDIRAVEGLVLPQAPIRAWQVADRKSASVFRLRIGDIIVGRVRPERRNVGLLLGGGHDVVGAPDGIAVVRVKREYADRYPQPWLFAALRSEPCRLQFWTESGGTSYGKLTDDHVRNVVVPIPPQEERDRVAQAVQRWAASSRQSLELWEAIGEASDRRPIVNSAIIGLESESVELDGGDETEGDDID